jgi:twitching motility protein PilJ
MTDTPQYLAGTPSDSEHAADTPPAAESVADPLSGEAQAADTPQEAEGESVVPPEAEDEAASPTDVERGLDSPSATAEDVVVLPAAAHQWRLVLPLLLLCLTAAAYLWEQERRASEDAFRLVLVQQSELAARTAASAVAAARGARADVLELRRLRTRAAAAQVEMAKETFKKASPGLRQATRSRVEALEVAWQSVREAADRLMKLEGTVATVRADVEAFQSIATGIIVTADELVDVMVASAEPPRQIRAASRQLLLIQRVSANIRRALEGDETAITTADRFVRDAVSFGEVNNALLDGDAAMGIGRVADPEGREILVNIGRDFRRSVALIEQITAGAVALVNAREAADDVSRETALISGLARELEGLVTEHRAVRAPTQLLTEIFAVLALLSVLAVMAHMVATARRAKVDARRQFALRVRANAKRTQRETQLEFREQATEAAMRCLVDELQRLSRGELYSDVDLKEIISETPLAPLEVAVKGVRRRLHTLARAAAKVSSAGAEFVRVASSARAVADEQCRQVERVDAVTKRMAAHIEPVSDGGRQASQLAAQSLQSLRQESDAVGEAGVHTEQTLMAAKNVAARVRQLNESTRRIEEIGQLVDEISEQCRMLSLNVSIRASFAEESAHPGAARFAQDLQKLADDARRALRRIQGVNEDVRSHAAQVADSIKQVLWTAEKASQGVRTAAEGMSGVTTLAQRLETLNRALLDALREHAVQMTEAVKWTTSVNGVASQSRRGIQDFAASASRLAELARLLEAAMEKSDDAQAAVSGIVELPAKAPASPSSSDQDVAPVTSAHVAGSDPG